MQARLEVTYLIVFFWRTEATSIPGTFPWLGGPAPKPGESPWERGWDGGRLGSISSRFGSGGVVRPLGVG